MAEHRFKSLGEDDRERHETRRDPVAKKKEPSVLSSILSGFLDEDIDTAIERTKDERIIPDLKHMAFNAITDVAGMLLGEGRSYSRSKTSLDEGRRTSNAIGTDNRRVRSDGGDTIRNSDTSRGFDSRDYIFDTRGKAERVLEVLRDECAEVGKVSLARFFEETKNKVDWTDWDIGWRELDRTNSLCRPTRGGYILILPKPVSIKNR